jgi:hypothetical protein
VSNPSRVLTALCGFCAHGCDAGENNFISYPADIDSGSLLGWKDILSLRPYSFASDWWVGTISSRIAFLIYINFN